MRLVATWLCDLHMVGDLYVGGVVREAKGRRVQQGDGQQSEVIILFIATDIDLQAVTKQKLKRMVMEFENLCKRKTLIVNLVYIT